MFLTGFYWVLIVVSPTVVVDYRGSYTQNLILVNLILVNFGGFLVITRNHERFEGRH